MTPALFPEKRAAAFVKSRFSNLIFIALHSTPVAGLVIQIK